MIIHSGFRVHTRSSYVLVRLDSLKTFQPHFSRSIGLRNRLSISTLNKRLLITSQSNNKMFLVFPVFSSVLKQSSVCIS